MTSGLRKVHKYSWLIIIVLLSMLILFSIKDLDTFSSDNTISKSLDSSTISPLKFMENELVRASLIENENTISIEIILKSSLKNPSSLVYALNKNDKKGELIGQLTTVGIYTFNTNESLKGIIIYDALKETIITKLAF